MMKIRLAIVVSEFNQAITDKLLQSARNRLIERGVRASHITVVRVPGAVEIPLTAQLLAKSKNYSAIICLGAVVRGDTNHYDYVCQQVSQGCQQAMLDFDIPIIFGLLTTDSIEQAEERAGGKKGDKGIEAADAALAMVKVVSAIINT